MRNIVCTFHKFPFFQGNPVSMFVLQTLVLYECEKHPREEDWEEVGATEHSWKIIGIEVHSDCVGLGF